MARSDKLYSDSPKAERGEDGKVTVKRSGAKPKAKQDMGEMSGRHAREMQEMHARHLDEHKAMSVRHEKEAEAQAAAAPPPADPAAQSGAGAPGAV